MGDDRRREGEGETFNKALSTGLVKETTIPKGADEADVRAPRKVG